MAMKPILIRGARLIDPAAGTEAAGDLLIVDRQIAAVGPGLAAPDGAEIVEAAGLVLAPGLIDAGVFRTDVEAAVAGGITSVLLMPDQSPPLDDPALIERAERLGKPRLWVRPLAAATRGLNGRELAELSLMKEAGAVAVATGRQAIADAQVMLRLLRYAAGLGLVVIAHAECPFLTAGAAATDTETATRLGLPAAPAAAEAIQIARDLRLAREAGAPLHIACVSTAEGVELIRAARAEGQDVTAGTAPAYALLSDTALAGYRSFARLSPPLRGEADRLAVREGLADGSISILASRHDPRTQEDKRLPFADAAPGAAGSATLLALGLNLVHDGLISLPRLLALLSANPAARFGLPGGALLPGAPADLLLFDSGAPWRIDADRLPGRAGNTPFDGLPVQGRVRLLLKGGERLA
ncbi:amidohydrolase family protein [Sandaracinobacter neustonicus]|uniref:Amidohydrolase family protein n=2 Tax=Sandaracinobacter neustonicus TaxID=1715348 RepID=A0A501XJV8_9SPHN|nr:amidohydrolase family protein [Sandaracinobacter neustonicus]TPE60457.1 amidohydrolase family protein [Sandaracinobacter neustonicus]